MEYKTKEQWKEHAKKMKNMRRRRCFQFKEVIKELRDLGFTVVEVSHHQYRINDALDIFPANKMYHDRVKRERGKVEGQDLRCFIRQYFGLLTNR
jgi:DNA-binding ferritin-like protein (Dps family)